jgi:AraC-like DNA-binding protein
MIEAMVLDDVVPHITDHVFIKCTPDWRVWESQISGHELIYIIKGKARYTINGIEYEIESGDLLYLNEGDIVEAVTYPQNLMRCFTVNFTPRRLAPKKAADAEESIFPILNHIGLRRDVVSLFRELTASWTERQQGYILKTRALLMLILHRLSELIARDADSTPADYRINRITRYISAHYAEKLTVKVLARQVNLDENYCGHLFKREMGMTIHQYITKVRVHNAENILQNGGCKIHEAAELCGFSDTFHFYKSFKTLRGYPPSRCIPRK